MRATLLQKGEDHLVRPYPPPTPYNPSPRLTEPLRPTSSQCSPLHALPPSHTTPPLATPPIPSNPNPSQPRPFYHPPPTPSRRTSPHPALFPRTHDSVPTTSHSIPAHHYPPMHAPLLTTRTPLSTAAPLPMTPHSAIRHLTIPHTYTTHSSEAHRMCRRRKLLELAEASVVNATVVFIEALCDNPAVLKVAASSKEEAVSSD